MFFGGGTPSLLPAADLTAILDAIPRTDAAEVTVECNPDSVDEAKLAAYRAGGVNRLSFGVQSMQPHVLAELGRTHDPDNVERAVRYARDAGFTSLNLDLIYGSPSESVDDWRRTLDATLALAPEHVSAYALTVEPGTPLGQAVAAGTRVAPDDDDQAEKYELADDVLRASGRDWYEISNWAQPGHECRHNLVYWRAGGLRRDRRRRARPRRRPPPLERPHARAVRRRGARRTRRPRPAPRCSTPAARDEEALVPRRPHPRGDPGRRRDRRLRSRSSPPTACSSSPATGPSSPAAAGCSPRT